MIRLRGGVLRAPTLPSSREYQALVRLERIGMWRSW